MYQLNTFSQSSAILPLLNILITTNTTTLLAISRALNRFPVVRLLPCPILRLVAQVLLVVTRQPRWVRLLVVAILLA
jgi:hypothetical protein